MSEVNLIVRTFRMGTDKEASLKPLEEAAEVFAAWQVVNDCATNAASLMVCKCEQYHDDCGIKTVMADEIADCIQACVNLADRYGIDLQAAMELCEKRNRERGRYE